MPLKRVLVAAIAGVAIAAIGGSTAYRLRDPGDILPDFTEPGPGERAPTTQALGIHVGFDRFDAVKAATAKARCADASMRAMIQDLREAKKAELAAAREKGTADAVTGASIIGHKTKGERNPQIRWSCAETPSELVPQPPRRPPLLGRWLIVLDSPDHPARHVSFRRNHPTRDAALADMKVMEAHYREVYGTPAMSTLTSTLAPNALVQIEWRFSDLRIELTALDTGTRGVDVNEQAEVPWPVRPDAPSR